MRFLFVSVYGTGELYTPDEIIRYLKRFKYFCLLKKKKNSYFSFSFFKNESCNHMKVLKGYMLNGNVN